MKIHHGTLCPVARYPVRLAFGVVLIAASSFAQVAQAGTTILVNSTADPPSGVGAAANCTGGPNCTLRDAIAAAAMTPGDNTINFSVGSNKTITLTSNTTLTLGTNLFIDGSASPGLTIDGNHAVTVFKVNAAADVIMRGLTIAHGEASIVEDGGLVRGGAIYNAGALIISRSTISDNHSNWSSGGIHNIGTLSMSGSTIMRNAAPATAGGGIENSGTLSLVNCTISENSAFQGAGIDNRGQLTFMNCTLFNNFNLGGLGSDLLSNSGNLSTVTTTNTLFTDCYFSSGSVAGSGNLDAGTGCKLQAADSNAKLDLGNLEDHGGGVLTAMPGPGSAAIDHVSFCAVPNPSEDARGVSRPKGVACDAGAVEVDRRYVKFDATGANDGTSWNNAYTNLQAALALASPVDEIWVARGIYKPTATDDQTIAFNIPPQTSVYGGFAGSGTLRDPATYRTVLSGDIDGDDTGVDGVDADWNDLYGSNSFHVVVIDGTTSAGPATGGTVLDGFTITAGVAQGSTQDNGGALLCKGSGAGHACSPTLSNLHFSGNAAAENGGALYNDGGGGGRISPSIRNTTFSGNYTIKSGAAVYNFAGNLSAPTYANVTFSGNRAEAYAGAVYNHANAGSVTFTMTNVTFNGNTGQTAFGGLVEDCGATATVTSTLTNVILWGDTDQYGPAEVEFNCATDTPTFTNSVLQGSGGSGVGWNQAVYKNDGGGNVAADPKLGLLQDNGGSTPTRMPGSGSSALNAGLDSACTSAPVGARDQRGLVRPAGAHCEIGAVEVAPLVLNVSDGSAYGLYGETRQYVVTLQNLSATDPVSGISVSGLGTAALDGPNTQWFCTVGDCTTTQTHGPFADVAALGPNGTVTWLVSVPILAASQLPTAAMTIRSNSAGPVSDTDALAIFRGTFDGP